MADLEFQKAEGAKIITYKGLSAVLTKDSISFWSGPILVFDCPVSRIIDKPRDALRAMDIVFQMVEMACDKGGNYHEK